jgi:hypothetical protein
MVRGSPLPAVIARGQAGFPAEELLEMAGIGVAHVQCDFHYALLCFAEQSARCIQPQFDLVVRRRHAHGIFEKAVEVKFTQASLCRQPVKVELFGDVFRHPISDLPELVAGQRRTCRCAIRWRSRHSCGQDEWRLPARCLAEKGSIEIGKKSLLERLGMALLCADSRMIQIKARF